MGQNSGNKGEVGRDRGREYRVAGDTVAKDFEWDGTDTVTVGTGTGRTA